VSVFVFVFLTRLQVAPKLATVCVVRVLYSVVDLCASFLMIDSILVRSTQFYCFWRLTTQPPPPPPPPIIITSNTFNYIRGGNELIHLLHFSKIFFFDRYVVCRLLTNTKSLHILYSTPPKHSFYSNKIAPLQHTRARIEALVQVVVVYADFVRAFGTVMPMVRYRNAYCNAVGSTSANRPPSPLCDSP
jgi:hypothetical protein